MHEVVCGEQGNVDHRSRRATTARLAGELGDAATASFEAIDTDTCSRAFSEAAAALVGFDVVVVAIGKVAFGPVRTPTTRSSNTCWRSTPSLRSPWSVPMSAGVARNRCRPVDRARGLPDARYGAY